MEIETKALVLVKKIRKSRLVAHKPEDLEGRIFRAIDMAVDGSGYLCVISEICLEMIEKEDTDQSEITQKILRRMLLHLKEQERNPLTRSGGDFE